MVKSLVKGTFMPCNQDPLQLSISQLRCMLGNDRLCNRYNLLCRTALHSIISATHYLMTIQWLCIDCVLWLLFSALVTGVLKHQQVPNLAPAFVAAIYLNQQLPRLGSTLRHHVTGCSKSICTIPGWLTKWPYGCYRWALATFPPFP